MFHTIVFSGGANHAAVFLGCIRYLEHTTLLKHVRKVVGSSAGSLVALMLTLGLTSDEMRAWTLELVEKHAFNKISLDDALDFTESFGIDKGQNLDNALRATMAKYSSSSDPTFKELAQSRGMDFSVCVLNVTKREYEYMSVDTTPNMLVRVAVRMSMSVPLMFVPVLHEGSLYIDPVLGRNFPYDYPGSCYTDTCVLGLTVRESPPLMVRPASKSLAAFVMSLVSILVHRSNEHMHRHSYTMVDVVVDDSVDKFSFDSMEFAWNPSIVRDLACIGYTQIQKVLEARVHILYEKDFTEDACWPPTLQVAPS